MSVCILLIQLCIVGSFEVAPRSQCCSKRSFEALALSIKNTRATRFFLLLTNGAKSNLSSFFSKRGLRHYKTDRMDMAISDFSAVILLAPKEAQPYINRADAFLAKHEYRRALCDYNAGIRLGLNHPVIHFNRGLANQGTGELVGSIADFTRSISLDPKYSNAYTARASIYRTLGDNRKALEDYNKSISVNPDSFIAVYNRGLLYKELNQYESAIKDFSHAIDCDSDNPLGFYRLAWELSTCASSRLRDGKSALKHAERACKLTDWRDPFCFTVLAAAYAECGNFDLAVKWQAEALSNPQYAAVSGEKALIRLNLYKHRLPYREKGNGR